jgi:hypothetical protein
MQYVQLALQHTVGAVHEMIIDLWQGHILVGNFKDKHFLEKMIVIQLTKGI